MNSLSRSAPVKAIAFTGGTTAVALTATGVTAGSELDGGPVPAAFVAATVKVYGVPFVSPVTVYLVTLPTVTGDPLDGVIT
jgi:hypothetical protein